MVACRQQRPRWILRTLVRRPLHTMLQTVGQTDLFVLPHSVRAGHGLSVSRALTFFARAQVLEHDPLHRPDLTPFVSLSPRCQQRCKRRLGQLRFAPLVCDSTTFNWVLFCFAQVLELDPFHAPLGSLCPLEHVLPATLQETPGAVPFSYICLGFNDARDALGRSV